MKIQPTEPKNNDQVSAKIGNRELSLLSNPKGTIVLGDAKNNLHKSFSKMLILAQIFGFLPTQGILGPDYRSANFTWRSVRVLYSFLTILGACFVSAMQMHKIGSKGMDLLESDRLFFNCAGVISGGLFLSLARKWPKLIQDWCTVELSMSSYGWPTGLNRKIHTLLVSFMVLALVEYVLLQSNKLHLALTCNSSSEAAFTYFFSYMSFSHIFSVMNYDIFKGLLLQFIHLQLTFINTFNDVFVMILSTALASRLSQITVRIDVMAEKKVSSENIWRDLREDYNKLCALCCRVNDAISYIVLMTFASDLFFILVQLFNSLRNLRSDLERVYFYWSFGVLILKTVCLCLYGAKVNDESVKPITLLNAVPSEAYNLEIQRFIQQIGTCEVAITGKEFFYITRGLILSIAGAIVTYELVLIQFNDSLLKSSHETIGSCPVYV